MLIKAAQRTWGTTPATCCTAQGRHPRVDARGTHQPGARQERRGPCASQGDRDEASVPGTATAPQSSAKKDDRGWPQDPAEHAPAGTSAQHARGMMEGGFRRWPKELSVKTQGYM